MDAMRVNTEDVLLASAQFAAILEDHLDLETKGVGVGVVVVVRTRWGDTV